MGRIKKLTFTPFEQCKNIKNRINSKSILLQNLPLKGNMTQLQKCRRVVTHSYYFVIALLEF